MARYRHSASGPYRLFDGRSVSLYAYCHSLKVQKRLREFDVLNTAFRADEETRMARNQRLLEFMQPIQHAWGAQLGSALDTLYPGLSGRLPELARARADAAGSFKKPDIPIELRKQEHLLLACAFLYWSDATFTMADIGKFANSKVAQLAAVTHPAQGTTPCSKCGKDADVRITARIAKLRSRSEGFLTCSHCGHTEELANQREHHWQNALVLGCKCPACTAEAVKVRDDIMTELSTVTARLAGLIRDQIAKAEAMAESFNTVPLDKKVQARVAKDLAQIGLDEDGIIQFDSRWQFVRTDVDEVVNNLRHAMGGAYIALTPLADLSDDSAIVDWCIERMGKKSYWAQFTTPPNDPALIPKWVEAANGLRDVLEADVPLPLAGEVGVKDSDEQVAAMQVKAVPQPPAAQADVAPPTAGDIAKAVALLKTAGYIVFHSNDMK